MQQLRPPDIYVRRYAEQCKIRTSFVTTVAHISVNIVESTIAFIDHLTADSTRFQVWLNMDVQLLNSMRPNKSNKDNDSITAN